MGVNHRLVELVIGHFAGFRHGHFTDHGQPVNLRVQRAQTVGQLLRQHRHHALREVHRVATYRRLFVQRRTDLDVMGHVSNGYVEFPAAGKQLPARGILLAVHGIIEVAGIFTIDGNERQVAQIDALFLVLLFHLRLELGSLSHHGIRPDVRNVVAAQRNVDFHARRHVVADHFDNIALRLEARRRPMGDFYFNELADLGIACTARRHQHFLLNLRVVGEHKANATFLVVTTHEGFVRTGDHFRNRAFAPTAAIQTRNPRQGTVTIKDQAHLTRTEEQVITAIIRNQEAEAVAMTANPAKDQIKLVHRRISAAASVNQLTVTLHCAQTAAQGLDLIFSGQAKLFHQLLTIRGRTAVGQLLQNQLTAGDGVVIFFRFTSGLGIEGLPIGH